MKAFRTAGIGTLLLLSACKIEPTPDEYFDKSAAEEADLGDAAAEVRDRVLAMGQALSRRNPDEALAALAPGRDLYVVGPAVELHDQPTIGAGRTGVANLGAILAELGAEEEPVRTREVSVRIGPRGSVAWFHALLDVPSDSATPVARFTGVYLMNGGAWELVQAHLSTPTTIPAATSPEAPVADSAAVE